MELGTIFGRSDYAEGYKYAQENGYDIVYLGENKYKITEKFIPLVPSIEEQNEEIRANREAAYISEADPLKQDYDEAVARGAENTEELKQAWLAKKDEIRANNPYIKEESPKDIGYEDIGESLLNNDTIEVSDL